MSFESEYNALRKKRKEQDEQDRANKFLSEYNAARQKSEERRAAYVAPEPIQSVTPIEDIAPVEDVVHVDEPAEEKKWYQKILQKGAFEDGYQIGDVLKTIGGTVVDAGVSAAKGIGRVAEGVSDAISYGIAGVADLVGADETAEYWREVGKHDAIGTMTKGVDEALDDYSVLGDTSSSVAEGLGQVATIILTGGAAAGAGAGAIGTTAATTGLMGVSSFGGGVSEAYEDGATDNQALAYGVSKGVIDAGSELIFGGLGKAVNAIGLSKGLSSVDDMLAKKLSNKISNTFYKNLVQYGVKSSAEGVEEVLAGIGTAIAKDLTYMNGEREEDLLKLLKDENLMEQFVVGAVTSGIAQSGIVPGMKNGSLIETTKNGQDFVTGLTKNETAVVEKEFENRLAEKEKDGNKLNKREKTKLYDEVLEDMEKGYISTDTIEEVLGGDSYKTYQDTVTNEDTILNEFEELGKKENPTLADQSRYAELTEQVKQIKDNSKRNELKSKLGESVFGLVKDGKLAESYNESARRSQSFEADLTKYKGKQAENVKKAIESGVLNNTRKTHEFVDFVSKAAADTGVSFDFADNKKLKESGFALEGKTVNGFVTKDGITINVESKKALNTVVGHEITHVLEGTDLYTELQKVAIDYAKAKNDYQGRYDTLAKLYNGVEGANIEAELTADLIGDYLFTDSDFVNHLVKNRNVFQKIFDEIKHLVNIATAGSKEKRDLEKVKRAFEKAYRESGGLQGDTKYSLSDNEQNIQNTLDNNDKKLYNEFAWATRSGAMTENEMTDLYSKVGIKGTLDKFEHHSADGEAIIEVNDDPHKNNQANNVFVFAKGTRVDDLEITRVVRVNMFDEDSISIFRKGIYDSSSNRTLETYAERIGDEFLRYYDRSDYADYKESSDQSRTRSSGSKSKGNPRTNRVWTWRDGTFTETQTNEIAPINETSSTDGVFFDGKNAKLSLSSDSDGNNLTQAQSEYFKDSKMRDDNGNLKVMYHGSQDAGFHVFDPAHSDDETSLFFVDSNDVAASYSGTSETYEAQTIKTAEDMNKFIESVGAEGYEVVEKDGKYTLLHDGDRVADSKTAHGIYEEFCWYEGIGEGDANYKVYLNLTNPLVVDAEGRNWNNVSREFSQEIANRYNSLTTDEKAALSNLAEWGEYSIFRDEMLEARATAEQGGSGVFDAEYTKNLARAYEKLGGANANLYDAFSIAQENFSEESLKEFAFKQMNTRDYAQKAKSEGYDGVIFKNIVDVGGYGNGSEGASTVAIAFDSNQVKSVANENPTKNADIRYSLSEDSQGRMLTENQEKYFEKSVVRDDNGNLLAVKHGTNEDFDIFDFSRIGKNGKAEGYGFYFSDDTEITGRYGGIQKEVYLNITKPLSQSKKTMTKASLAKFVNAVIDLDISNYGEDGLTWQDSFVSNYINTYERGMTRQYAVREFVNQIWDYNTNDFDLIYEVANGDGKTYSSESMREFYDVLTDTLGYDGVIAEWSHKDGVSKVYVTFNSEQSKYVTNANPTLDVDMRKSLSPEAEAPKRYGDYNVYGEDIRLEAPVREEVSEDSTATVSKMKQVEDTAPLPTSHDLRARQAELENQIRAAYDAKDQENVSKLMAEHDDLTEQIKRLDAEEAAMESDRVNSLSDADAPPEADAPYYGEEENAAPVLDPFEERDIKDVGKRNVKAYMYENPEVKPFFQAEAEMMLADLHRSTKGERFYTSVEGGVPGTYGAESYGVWSGVSRHVHPDIEYMLDTLHYSYADIEKGLKAIIEDNGKENNACSKRIEFILNDRLLKGSVDMDYPTAEEFATPPNQEYINLLKEKDIKEYSEEARKKFFDVADEYAPAEDVAPTEDDIAPVAESKPEAKKDNAEPVTSDIRNDRAKNVFNSIKKLQSGKYHEVGGYGFHLARSSKHERATITIKTPDGKKLQRVIDGGNFWKNARLWAEASNMVAEYEYPNAKPKTGTDEVTGKIAKIVTNDQDATPKKRNGFMQARTAILDKFSVFEDLALKHKNRELDAKANYMRYAENAAQRFIGKGTNGVRALNDLRTEVENSGLYDQFQEYMYDMHNTDRMSLEDKTKPTIERLNGKFEKLRMEQIQAIAAKEITDKTTEKTAQTIKDAKDYLNAIGMRNKPVRGFDYTADVSRANAAKLEAQHPQFKKWAQDVYKINEFLRDKLVADGEISRETADLWAELYPHYVPIRRLDKSGVGVSVPLDTNKTGVNAPVKRATGGDGDIGDLFKTLAMRAEQTFKAGARNSFGLELKNTLGAEAINQTQTTLDEMTESVENQDERLKKGENGGKPTFTVFEDGKRVEFEISEEMYDALKPTSDLFSGTNKVLNTATEIQRKILTEWNIMFTAGNAIKDAQDVLINSQHAVRTYKEFPNAIKELLDDARGVGGKWITEYLDNGGEQLTYFDGQEKTFTEEDTGIKKVLGYVPRKISDANNFVERVPRLAEYIASRKAGASIEVAMLDAARVTTNFAAGGDVTKWANRNGATFLNASVQGFNQQVRNFREAKANGLKGTLTLAAKFAAAGLPVLLLNHLLWGDDEEYEELSDYVKDNYYIVGKFGDGKFVRIPKGRTVSVIQNAFEQMKNLITGNDEVDLKRFGDLLVSNLAPNDPLNDGVWAPIKNAIENKTWYGDDLVPTRLQDLPKAEQFDESTDSISKWLGEKTNTSPYKINYLLDQYSGGIGDVVLPMLTPESDGGGLLAPWKDKFTTDSVMKNQNVSDFYDTVDELTTNAKSADATDEDVLKSKYMNSVNSTLGDLYAQKREIQNSDLSDAEKSEAVRTIQKQITALAKESLETYENVVIDNGYATVGELQFITNNDGEWQKLTDEQIKKQDEVTGGLGISPSEYWNDKKEYDFAYEYPEKYEFLNNNGVTYDDYQNGSEEFKEAYTWAYNNPDKFTMSQVVSNDVVEYRRLAGELYDIKADKDEDGKTINGSRKEKVIDWLNDLDDLDYGAKLILFKSEYNADDTYNYEIIDYLNGRNDVSYQQMETILKSLGFNVSADGTITWD